MIDKLILTTPRSELTKEIAGKLLQGHYSHSSMTATRFHSEVVVFHKSKGIKGRHLLSLHLNPRFSNLCQLKIEINPSHFSSHREMDVLLSKITDTNELNISRVDHAVDLESHSVGEIHSRLVLSRKKAREVYKNGIELESFYLGKPPERLLIYNKALQEGLEGNLKTRIELQQYRERVQIRGFKNLADYQSFCPFQSLKFNCIGTLNQSPRDIRKAQELEKWFQAKGAQATHKIFNRHSNYKRDYGHLLVPDLTIPNLDQIYQKNLVKYFEGVKQ